VEWLPWGGAYTIPHARATAFVHRIERFCLKYTAISGRRERRLAAHSWADRCWEMFHVFGTGSVYQNFPDPQLADPARAYFGQNLTRLLNIKHRYDPDDVFRSGNALSSS
jgi:Berberine and berberine like